MKVGVNGAVRDISDLKVGANGAVRAVSEAYIGVNGAVKKVWPLISPGHQVALKSVGSGTWVCPATGTWEVEIHGGGGGGGGAIRGGGNTWAMLSAGGSGSGEKYTATYTIGQSINYTIGPGGKAGKSETDSQDSTDGENGGKTTFGSYSINGGGGGGTVDYMMSGFQQQFYCIPGTRSGSIAEQGQGYDERRNPRPINGGSLQTQSWIVNQGGTGGASVELGINVGKGGDGGRGYKADGSDVGTGGYIPQQAATNGYNGGILLTYLG